MYFFKKFGAQHNLHKKSCTLQNSNFLDVILLRSFILFLKNEWQCLILMYLSIQVLENKIIISTPMNLFIEEFILLAFLGCNKNMNFNWINGNG